MTSPPAASFDVAALIAASGFVQSVFSVFLTTSVEVILVLPYSLSKEMSFLFRSFAKKAEWEDTEKNGTQAVKFFR